MRIRHWLYAACISVGVLVACWVAADRTATSLVGDKLAQSVDAGQTVADRVADGMIHAINTDLAMVRAIPSTLAEVDLLRDVLRPESGGTAQAEVVDRANEFLRGAQGYFGVDRVWVIDTRGVCVAASNFRDAPSPIGQSVADKPYVTNALLGARFESYAAGWEHQAPGLYFSAPVYREGALIGVVMTKIGLTRLRHWVGSGESFVTDGNGVVIMANDPRFENRFMLDGKVGALSDAQRQALYQRNDFARMPITQFKRAPGRSNAWVPQELLDRMSEFDEFRKPFVITSRPSSSNDLIVYAVEQVDAWEALTREHAKDFALCFLLYLGGVVIVMLAGWTYWRERVQHRETRQSNEELRAVNNQLAFEASYDELTGSLTRRYFFHRFDQLLEAAQRKNEPMSLIVADLDHFKSINDTYGHAIGDQVLCRFVLVCSSTLRGDDLIGRIGGEEFAILLPGASERDALRVADRIRERCKRESLEGSEPPLRFSASFGITEWQDEDSPMNMVERADMALYRAKRAGRDRCWVF
ncbi:diguanylate cyclase [Pandoraea fibrosis]|uniref:diguanylate cyclase n=1 Tax=Pandoraea fibrosis TaxID=1891094 RepID=A0ABX6HTC1_9BURK|nr:sensor domain-containing diguanylate cyclase [Pandoraea fibrosis]QHE92928.1 diguanylate cyclase [Pandoraea fibrosis]QHF13515.1 diguanylate cyclase [Pandoraea fibrosis]